MSKKKKEYNRIERQILSLFKSQPKRIYNHKQLSAQLEIKDTQGRNNIIRVLNGLRNQKQLSEVNRGQYRYNAPRIKYYESLLNVLPTGKGKVVIETHEEEILVPKKQLNKALDGDLVVVSLHKKENEYVAHVEDIIERGKKEYIGIFERQKDFGFVLCRKGAMYTDLFIKPGKLYNFKDGEKVVAVFKSWDEGRDAPNGKIIKSLGEPGTSETEIHAILHEYGLPYEFPKQIEAAAQHLNIEIEQSEIKKRRDFRNELTFTIDPITAKDFDDAISFKKQKNGEYEIGIHIADVSHYVQPNTILDKEAYDRATSVYLVDRVVPMLPEVLSNGLCSLRPKEEKYTFSAVFKMDEEGTVHNRWFGRTAIHSDRRFAYEEAQQIIEDNHPEGKKADFYEAIRTLDGMAKKLRAARMGKGALSFDKKEVKFHLDENNEP